MGEYQKIKLVFTYFENGAGNGIINRGFKAKILQNTNERAPKISAKWPLKLHNQLPEIRLRSKAIVLKQPIKKIRINSNNSISPEFHPATKPLTVEPVDSGNEIAKRGTVWVPVLGRVQFSVTLC